MIIPIANRARSSEASRRPRRRTPWCAALVAAAVAAAALPGTAHAQPSLGEPPAPTRVDQRWLPWLGCWQLVEEAGALPDSSGDLPAFANRVLVCVTPPAGPAPATDVLVTTLAGGERVLQETLSADGRDHAVDQSECRGRRRIAWSGDGARLFTQARLTCNRPGGRPPGVRGGADGGQPHVAGDRAGRGGAERRGHGPALPPRRRRRDPGRGRSPPSPPICSHGRGPRPMRRAPRD